MTGRVLPRDEWFRLAGTELEGVVERLPLNACVVVVEQDERIIGCWSLLPVVHVEGLWLAPESRCKVGVVKALWNQMVAAARMLGAGETVMTACADLRVRKLLKHAGATAFPFQEYVLPIGESPCRPQ